MVDVIELLGEGGSFPQTGIIEAVNMIMRYHNVISPQRFDVSGPSNLHTHSLLMLS